jgi:hypothetical protein
MVVRYGEPAESKGVDPAESSLRLSLTRWAGLRCDRGDFFNEKSAAALPNISRFAKAQTYPTRTVRIIVGFAGGGPQVH